MLLLVIKIVHLREKFTLHRHLEFYNALDMDNCCVILFLGVIFISTLQCEGFVNPVKRQKETGECRNLKGNG